MELQAYLKLTQKTCPEFILMNSKDLSRILYSELKNCWIWNFLQAEALKMSEHILVNSFAASESIAVLRIHFLNQLRFPENPHVSIVNLKVLIVLILRNAIRFTLEDLYEVFSLLQKILEKPNKRLIETVFYTVMILLSIHENYNFIVCLQSILGNFAVFTEGRRMLYALESREGKYSTIVSEINEFFGFDLKIPESLIENSSKIILGCKHGEKLDVSEMDDRCLAAYINRGGKQVPTELVLNSFKTSSDVHFVNLVESSVEKLHLHISELQLIEILQKTPEFSYRVLFYSLLFNEKVKSQGYGFSFLFEIDVRKALKQAGKGILEKLLHLVNEHLPWFFICSLSGLDEPADVPESFLFAFSHSLPLVTEQDLVRFRQHLAYQPLKVALSILDVLEPLRTTQAQDLFNPLRVFTCLNLLEPKNIDVGTSLLEVLLSAWQQLILKYESPVAMQYRENFILTMQSACVQKLIDNLGFNDEIDSVVCDFLHGYWIENATLIQLVHTQGYPASLLSVTVSKIPSLICTWDFILELVQKGTSKQKSFSLQLAGHLSLKYPTQRLLEILRSCVQFIEDNLNIFYEDESLDSTLDLYVKAFPTLNGRVKKLKRKYPKNYFLIDVKSSQFLR